MHTVTTGAPDRPPAPLVLSLADALDERDVGTKARNLARLMHLGVAVPAGIVVTNAAFQSFFDGAGLRPRIGALCDELDCSNPLALRSTAEKVKTLFGEAPLPPMLGDVPEDWWAMLKPGPVIVRSSAIGEDSNAASFAGQLDSVSGITGANALRDALVSVWASRSNSRDADTRG